MTEIKDSTVLVTGATGFLGGALARRLAADGAHVKALARRPNRDRFIRDVNNIEIVMGDITGAERMREVMPGIDYVFHVAAATGGKLELQRRVNVGGTRNVMLAAADAGVKRVVHVSSIAVYGFGYTSDVSEDMPQKPGNVPYNISKSEAEAVVREVAADKGVSFSIIRPGMIYGPRSRGWTIRMFNLAKSNPTIFIGNGSGAAHPIHVDDVVDLTVLLALHPAAEGEAFNCSVDPAPTWREYLGAYSRLAGHNRWFGIPIPLVKLLAPILELGMRLRGEPQDLPAMLSFVQGRKTYKMDKARDLLGWKPKVDLQSGINSCVPYLREKGLLDEKS